MDQPKPTILQLPIFVKELATLILGEAYCYEEIVERLNFSNLDCLKLGLSKGLGIAVILGSCIVKIPQIVKIVKANSTLGISLASYLLETLCYIITISYNLRSGNPISTWGESVAITAQNVAILMLFPYCAGNSVRAAVFPLAALSLYHLFNRTTLISYPLLELFQAGTIPLVLLSRVPQIISNYSNGHTGHLSAFSVFNYLLGALIRTFTTLQEVDDKIILTGFLLSIAINSVLAFQMCYYWSVSHSPSAEKTKKTE